MIDVTDRLFVGGDFDCRTGNDSWAIVHACKSPCHQRAVGYRGSLHSSHPNYLVLEHEKDLYLNIIDPPVPLFKPQLFTSFLSFAGRHWDEGKKILIHCNKGESRSPTLAMMFMAKHQKEISNISYLKARKDFEQIFSGYFPGQGIQIYLNEHWSEF